MRLIVLGHQTRIKLTDAHMLKSHRIDVVEEELHTALHQVRFWVQSLIHTVCDCFALQCRLWHPPCVIKHLQAQHTHGLSLDAFLKANSHKCTSNAAG